MLQLSGAGKRFGTKLLFENVNWMAAGIEAIARLIRNRTIVQNGISKAITTIGVGEEPGASEITGTLFSLEFTPPKPGGE